MSDDFAPSFHESGHAVAAREFGLDMIHVSIRRTEDSLGRCSIQNSHTVDNFTGAIVMVAGHVAERMALERENCNPNWLLDDHDMESARLFIENSYGGDIDRELTVRQNVQLRARVLLRARWDAVTEIAELLQRNTTVLGEEVARICLAEAARRSARLAAAKPPQSPRPRVAKPKPAKKARRPSTGDREVRLFSFNVVKKGDG
jgi:hypothetical protein